MQDPDVILRPCRLIVDKIPITHEALKPFTVAHIMGKKTIAEFVESIAIREKWHLMGIDYVQGYAIQKPEPSENLLKVQAHCINKRRLSSGDFSASC